MLKSSYRRRCLVLAIVSILLVSFLAGPLLVLVQPVRAEPWKPGWQHRKSITIDHSIVGAGGLVNFPVLIDINDANLTSQAQPDGDDIYFTDNGGVQLSHEIELYSAGHLVAWVKVPSLSSSVDTVLYMYYGNLAAANQEDASGVWDANFMMVQHLEEVSGTHYDSTVNGNDGTAVNGVVRNAAGNIDGADSFDGTDDYVTIPHSSTLTGFTQAFAASCWIKMDNITGRRTILNKWNAGTGQRAWYIDYDSTRGANTLGLFVSQDGSAYSYWYAAFTPVAGSWYHIAVVWRSGQQPSFYVNGAAVTVTTSTARASVYSGDAQPLYIGRSYTTGRYFDGVIDEVRLSNQTRSAEWISTSYNNQVNPSNFYIVGPEESPGAPIVSNPYPLDGAINVQTSSFPLSFELADPNGDLMNFSVYTSPDIGSGGLTNQGNGTYTLPVSGLDYNTTYTWHVNVTDGVSWTNVTYTFTTESVPPTPLPPEVSNPNPPDGAPNVPVTLDELNFVILDPNEDLMDVYVTTDPDIGFGEGFNIPDSPFSVAVSGLVYETPYTWHVNVTDGTFWTNMTYTFTTESEPEIKRKALTINHSLVAANLVNFPVLIDITDSDLASEAQPDGSDIYFTDSGDVQLSHEIELYSAGHLVAWVKVPSLSSSVDTTLYMCYGDPGAGDPENPAAVWDANFMMVQHLNEVSGVIYDSTVNGNNGTAVNGVVRNAAGNIDGADSFDGTDDYVTIPDSNTLAGFTQFTASFWIKMDVTTGRRTILNKWNTGTGQRAWYIDYDASRGTNTLGLFVSADSSTAYSYWYAAFSPVAGNWYHIAIVWQSGVQALFYVNGSAVTATTSTARASIYNNAEQLYIGRSYTTGRYFDGVIDEVRISNVARSAQWIRTCYNTQMNPPTISGPKVLSHVPGVGANGVSRTTTINVTFSEPMNRSLTEGAFSVNGSVLGSFSWLNASAMMFTPASPLSYLTVYSVTISTAAMDMESQNMTAPYSWNFTTVASTPLYVVSHVPGVDATDVLTTTSITINFSEPVVPSSAQGNFSISPSVAGGFTWPNASAMAFTPTAPLAYLTKYTVTINDAMNLQGKNMTAKYSWNFTTVSDTRPRVNTVSPLANAVNVSLITTIQITFSEAMDDFYTQARFSISPSVVGTFTWSSSFNRITFTPTSPLAYNTNYTVTISDARDQQGENMTAPYSWNFTTIWPPTPPTVVSTIPIAGETNVNYTIFNVTFSEPMDKSPTETAFTVNGTNAKAVILYWPWANNTLVNFAISPLSSFTSYNVTITTAARDAQGENMTSKYSWIFRTGNVSGNITLKWTYNTQSLGTGESSPLIGDVVTSVLGEEVIYVGGDSGSSSGAVRCLNGITGAVIWSYTDTSIGWNVQPQMGDINNDGKFEIVVPLYSPTGILVLHANGSQYWKRTGIGGSSYTSKPVIVDPDGDGYWMVFCAPEDVRGYSYTSTYTARIWAFNYDGREIKNGLWGTAGGNRTATNGPNANLSNARYQWFAWRPCSGGFAMADTDNDGLFELYQNDRNMYMGDGGFAKGTIAWEWSPTTQNLTLKWYQPDMLVSSHTPILVDVNKDGVLDVVVAHQRGGLAIFNSTTGAEIRKDYSIGLPSHYQPVVYDIDRDGNPEILLADGDHPGSSPSDIVVFDLTLWKVDARMYVGPCKFPPTVGEVTGDGIMDIIAVSDNGIFVFDGSHNPAVDNTYPVTVVATGLLYQCMYAVVQDIDNDLKNEIVVTSSAYRVYAYDTPAPRTTPRPRSEVQYYNERRTGVAEYVPPVFYDRTAPILSNPYPSNEAINVPTNLQRLNFTLTDLQGNLMNYTVTTNIPVNSTDLTGVNKGNGTYSVRVTGTLTYHTKYTWRVSATDGAHWNNKSYTFTTPDGTPPGSAPTHSAPVLNSTGTGDYANATSVNLICTNQTTVDSDVGDKVTNIYRWLRNGQQIANLIMPFDTDNLTTAKDYSGYNNNGIIHGATWTNNGKVGGAYSFDGVDDYMLIPDGGAGYYNGRIYSSSLGGGGNNGNWSEMTVEMWINLAALSSKESTRILMKIPSYEIGLGSIGGSTRPNNRLTAAVWLDNPDSGDNAGQSGSTPPSPKATEYWSVSASSTLSTNTWYHVAFTYKDGKGTSDSILALYINGVQVTNSTSRTTRGPIKASSGEPLFIGWYDYFKGMIDEVRIYSRCLSKEQISLRYNETKDGLTNSSTLSQTETRTGETWTCQVTPNDSHQDGTARTSNTLLILPGPQVPPAVSNVQVWGQTSLSTTRVWSNETIVAIYSYLDENDDPQVFGGSFGTQIQWFKNGTYQPLLDNLTSLSTSITTAHEDWTYRIKPGDGYSVAADWVNATNKVIVNSPPVVTSYSPQYGYSLNYILLYVNQSQTFSFAFTEMDGDSVTIEWTLDSTVVAGNVTQCTFIANATGSFSIRATLTDTGYGKTSSQQRWSITVR